MAEETAHPQLIHKALQLLPSATFVLTCAHDKFRDGILTSWVQQCSTEPPMLIVAIPKGQQIEPLLRDARAFALCLVPPNDRRAKRLFNREHEREEDPFLALTTMTAETGMPILPESKLWFDCKLEGHLSPEADCRLYLGRVVSCYAESSLQKNNRDLITPPTNDKRVARATSSKSATRTRTR
ncbi:MAG TPA: flavin reductase family protein [Phycisphaerales bacterium]|jgi:flavin reductase (DIM6/NTAB) family NADH-FMN oxidoreductase RutF|nr:flavin reductase family protein [Phycisphaerales bacterium]HIB49953.1 flavin reductase family protein [Phycisphaerales bacterium]HIN84533.1 flavin reductase family protein [Phycisphaerales bacterium]HIO19574.1 flavin reductase family protein [Phycisphaerales bacterium]HIO52958.1 flavin reductase family protein [Phycisphaerales bacterium]